MNVSFVRAVFIGSGLGACVGLAVVILLMMITGAGSLVYLMILLASAISGGLAVFLIPSRSTAGKTEAMETENVKRLSEKLANTAEQIQREAEKAKTTGREWAPWADQAELLSEDLNRLSVQMAALSAHLASQAGDLPALASQAHRLADRGLDLKSRAKRLAEQMAAADHSLVTLTGEVEGDIKEVLGSFKGA